MANESSFYPPDFFIESLRGVRKGSPSMVRRMLAGRAQYLEIKSKDFLAQGRPVAFFIEELRAIAEVMRVYEEANPLPEGAMSFQQRFSIPPYTPEKPPTLEGEKRYPVQEKKS